MDRTILHIPRTTYARHLCAEGFGDLHSERTYASRRTVNQDLLPRLSLSLVAQTLQCGECRSPVQKRLARTSRHAAS
jgi:hypothetical protein